MDNTKQRKVAASPSQSREGGVRLQADKPDAQVAQAPPAATAKCAHLVGPSLGQPAVKANHTSSFATPTSSSASLSPKLSIANWAEEDRPREKLARLGAQALSNAELLAILIGSGSAKESAVELMKRVLADCNNNLNTLGKRTIHELTQYNGMGPAKAITILAACWASAASSKRLRNAPTSARPPPSTTTCTRSCKTSTPRRRGFCL